MKRPTITTQELADFLEAANQSTYANKAAEKAPATRLASEDYHYEQANLIYHDTYFGGRDFIGGETVYKDKVPVWGMNYYGYILDMEVAENDVYDFLRAALMCEPGDIIPIRGPKSFDQGVWGYRNNPQGDLARFTGTEDIFLNQTLVYRADYHGGFIR